MNGTAPTIKLAPPLVAMANPACASIRMGLRVPPDGFELALAHQAPLRKAAKPRRRCPDKSESGAGEGIRTLDPNLGKVLFAHSLTFSETRRHTLSWDMSAICRHFSRRSSTDHD
jgi:hypothetical protein